MGRLTHDLTICKECGVPGQVHSYYNLIPLWKCNNCGDISSVTPEVFRYVRVEAVAYTISADTVDRVVHRAYHTVTNPRRFNYVKNGDCVPGDCEEYGVVGRGFDKEDADCLRETGFWTDMSNGEILDILCADGWLDRGTYRIEIPE